MSERRVLRLVHLAGTVWFMLCAGYILALRLRQAGFDWWVIFSLSGHSALAILLLISLYLFAVFRGVGTSEKLQAEHPLTGTIYYKAFYVGSPFLGVLASCVGMTGVRTVGQLLLGIALGSLGTTFLVWVIVDPVLGLLEMLLPGSRRHRAERLAHIKALREERQRERKRLLARIVAQEEQDRRRRQRVLLPHAERLAGLLISSGLDFQRAENDAVDIGVRAWQMGGLHCMRQLRDMSIAICKERCGESEVVDYVSTWWDGIGGWRSMSPG